jgi:hypothetical protein
MNLPPAQSLRFWRTCALLMVAIACIYASTVQVAGVDFWLQAKIGEIIVQSQEIPRTLLFPFTEVADQRFNAHEWLSSVLFHGLLKVLGIGGLPLIHGLLGLVFLGMAIWLGIVRNSGNWATSLLGGLLAAMVENYRHVLRPELIATILLIYFWINLEKFRQENRWQNALLALFLQVIWVNVHGSFILGPLLAGVYCVGNHLDTLKATRKWNTSFSRTSRRFGYLALTSLAMCLFNPFGDEMLRFVLGFSNDPELRYLIGEWGPTLTTRWFGEPGWWIAMFVWISSALWICFRFRRLSAIDILIFLMFTALAVKAIRFPVYLGIVAAYLLSGLRPAAWDAVHVQIYFLKATAAVGLVLVCLIAIFGNAYGVRPYSYGLYRMGPEMEQALSNPAYQGNVFNSMELGAELIYRAYPRLLPTIDCRVDSYGLDYYKYTAALLTSPELFQEFIDRYQVRYMLYEIKRVLDAEKKGTFDPSNWRVLAQDRQFVFMKYEPSAAPSKAIRTTR